MYCCDVPDNVTVGVTQREINAILFTMAKSPERSRQVNSPFTKSQEIWLIQRSAFFSPTQLRRAFIKKFKTRNTHREAPDRSAFQRLVKRFEESGGTTGRTKEKKATVITAEVIARVEDFFLQNPKSHIRGAADKLQFNITTIWRVL